MNSWIILLRGINVGGHKKILMAELKGLFDSMGFKRIQTYIQSGNIVLKTAPQWTKLQLENEIERSILNHYKFDVKVFAINPTHLNQWIQETPFLDSDDVDTKNIYLGFLKTTPSAEGLSKLDELNTQPDQFVTKENIVYLYYRYGAGKTKLTTQLIESRLKVSLTARNWNTVNKLKEISDRMN